MPRPLQGPSGRLSRGEGMNVSTHRRMTRWPIPAVFFLFLVIPRLGWPQSDGLHKLFSGYYEFQLREDLAQATTPLPPMQPVAANVKSIRRLSNTLGCNDCALVRF